MINEIQLLFPTFLLLLGDSARDEESTTEGSFERLLFPSELSVATRLNFCKNLRLVLQVGVLSAFENFDNFLWNFPATLLVNVSWSLLLFASVFSLVSLKAESKSPLKATFQNTPPYDSLINLRSWRSSP